VTLNQCKQMIVASLFATCGMLAVPAIARTRPSQPIWINFINSTGSLLHHFPATFMGTSNGTDFFATHQAGAFSSVTTRSRQSVISGSLNTPNGKRTCVISGFLVEVP